MAGEVPDGKVVVYDDDHYYMGGVLAELLVQKGAEVTLVTPSAFVSDWSNNTLEQAAIHCRLVELGVDIQLNRAVTAIGAAGVTTACSYSGRAAERDADAVVLVTCRQQNDAIWQALKARKGDWAAAGIASIKVIGDAEAPGPIAWATYAGHRFARELDEPDIGDALPFRRELAGLQTD
jgi:dimethylamine/trimethylamine dehydrogenase